MKRKLLSILISLGVIHRPLGRLIYCNAKRATGQYSAVRGGVIYYTQLHEVIAMNTAKENLEAVNELSSKSYEAARELGELNLHTMEKLVSRQMDMMNMFMESGLRQVTMASEAKGYNDLIKSQIEMTKEVTERVMNESREAVKFANDARDEYRAWMESGMEVLNENLNQARKAAQIA